jgi:hypothetical protein
MLHQFCLKAPNNNYLGNKLFSMFNQIKISFLKSDLQSLNDNYLYMVLYILKYIAEWLSSHYVVDKFYYLTIANCYLKAVEASILKLNKQLNSLDYYKSNLYLDTEWSILILELKGLIYLSAGCYINLNVRKYINY